MKKAKQLKTYIMQSFVLFSAAIMLFSNLLETAMSKALELVMTHQLNGSVLPAQAQYYSIGIIVVFLVSQLLLLYFSVRLFGKRINQRIAIPVDELSTGLNKIMRGDLSTRLDFETENEFVHMRDSFNYMAVGMARAQSLKDAYEAERNMLFSNRLDGMQSPKTKAVQQRPGQYRW